MSNKLYFIGAAALEIISVAAIFAVEHLRQKRNQNLEKLEQQLEELREEIKKLQQLQSGKALKPKDDSESSTSEESDSEYFELSDSEDFPNTTTLINQSNNSTPCWKTLKELDKKLLVPNTSSIKEALDQLIKLNRQFPKNLELLWRIAQAHQLLSVATKDKVIRREHVDNGITACEAAFILDSESPQIHKWFTLLLGCRAQLQPLREKIKDAVLFKKQLKKALDLKPNDGILHYALGRFTYETANMTWFERKAASLIFGKSPSGTYEEALKYCLKAELLLKYEFKESRLTIAKCQIALGKYSDAVKSLKKAACFAGLDSTANNEITALLTKYSSYG